MPHNSLRSLLLALAVVSLTVPVYAQQPFEDLGAETATHVEGKPLPVRFDALSCLRLDAQGNVLAGDSRAKTITTISPKGQVLRTRELPFGPEAMVLAEDGTLYVGGQGRVAKVGAGGEILKSANTPDDAKSELGAARRGGNRPIRVSGLACTSDAVFVAFGSGWSTGSKSKLYRLSRDLEGPQLIDEGLRGCCQRCDLIARDDVVYLAENAAHRVVLYSGRGEVMSKWGSRSRTSLDGFGSCCNPMNLAFDAGGTLYTAESGLGRVKRYSTDGKYLGLVGYIGVERFTQASGLAASCSNIAIAVTPDGERVYVMDYKQNLIRVLERRK